MRRNIYRWYGELRLIENAVRRREGDSATYTARLDLLEERLDNLWVPHAYSADLYNMIAHIQLVRGLLRESPSNRNAREEPAGGSKRPSTAP
jgi:hypothetical protein